MKRSGSKLIAKAGSVKNIAKAGFRFGFELHVESVDQMLGTSDVVVTWERNAKVLSTAPHKVNRRERAVAFDGAVLRQEVTMFKKKKEAKAFEPKVFRLSVRQGSEAGKAVGKIDLNFADYAELPSFSKRIGAPLSSGSRLVLRVVSTYLGEVEKKRGKKKGSSADDDASSVASDSTFGNNDKYSVAAAEELEERNQDERDLDDLTKGDSGVYSAPPTLASGGSVGSRDRPGRGGESRDGRARDESRDRAPRRPLNRAPTMMMGSSASGDGGGGGRYGGSGGSGGGGGVAAGRYGSDNREREKEREREREQRERELRDRELRDREREQRDRDQRERDQRERDQRGREEARRYGGAAAGGGGAEYGGRRDDGGGGDRYGGGGGGDRYGGGGDRYGGSGGRVTNGAVAPVYEPGGASKAEIERVRGENKSLRRENDQLHERIADLEGRAAHGGDARHADDTIRSLEQDNGNLRRDVEELEQRLAREPVYSDVVRDLRESKMALAILTMERDELQQSLRHHRPNGSAAIADRNGL